MRELVASFEKVFGQSVPIVEAPPRPGDAVGALRQRRQVRSASGLEHRAHHRRRDRLRPGLGREAPGDPGLRMTRSRLATSVAALMVLVASLSTATPTTATRPRHDARAGDRAAARRADRGARPGAPARQPQLPAPDQPAGAGRRLPQAVQHHRHGHRPRLPGGDLRLAGVPDRRSAGSRRWVRGVVLTRQYQQPAEVGAVRRRARSGRQPARRRPQAEHPRRRLARRGRPGLPRDRSRRPARLDPRHLRAPPGSSPSTCARRCAPGGSPGPTTSPVATASTCAATWAPSTSPTCRRRWSSSATCATPARRGG